MSLETALTEHSPHGSGTAQHASKLETNPQSTSFVPLAGMDCSEMLPSETRDDGCVLTSNAISTPEPQTVSEPEPEADAQILEALRSAKDRLFVLKLGESMESLIQDRHTRNRLELTPASTYHKLLVHRCAAYYKLTPETEAGSKAIAIVIATESRIPARRVADLVPLEDSPLPTFKIMRRTPLERTRHKASSQGGSGNDDTAGEVSDGDPSENGSSRSSRRKPLTMSERQAQYDEARSRIFKDLEDKDKKAQDISASSSTLSLLSVSSSGGAGGTNSVGESLDEMGSIDRELVAGNDNQESGRKTGSTSSASRRTAPPYNGHGHSSSFNYPSLYEPAPVTAPSTSTAFESPSSGSSAQSPYHPTLYPVYQYGGPAYLAPFPYPYYPYPPPPSHILPPHQAPPQHHHPPESATNSSGSGSPGSSPADSYPPVAFVNPYLWGPPPPPPPPHQQPPQPQVHPHQPHAQPSEPQQSQAQGIAHPGPEYPHPHTQYHNVSLHAYTYPPQGPTYVQSLPSQVAYSHNGGHPQAQGLVTESSRPANISLNHVNGTNSQPQLHQPGPYHAEQGSTSNVRSSARNGSGTPPKRMQPRSGWSYGPGVGGPLAVSETMGPRLSITRRTSSGNGGYPGNNRAPPDETASSTSSSTSSSSSRQTFTSTSSKHPLPPRPDWAVGLKPQPTLHHPNSHHSSPRSHHVHLPSQAPSHHHSQQRPPFPSPLQSNDFPPLPVSSHADKRPVLGGVWAGSTTTRSKLGPPSGSLNNGTTPDGREHENVPMDEGQLQPSSRLDEHDHIFERPKGSGELFNPNVPGFVGNKPLPNGAMRRVNTPPDKESAEKDRTSTRGETIANAILVDRMAMVRIKDEGGDEHTPPKDTVEGRVETTAT